MSSTALRRALRRAEDAKAIDAVEAVALLGARGEELGRLAAAAGRVRDAGLQDEGRPGVVTYSRKVFIPLTRLCRDRCRYCTFATVPGRLVQPFLSPDEVVAIARAGAAAGCKEALFTLGDTPEARWPAARTWLESHGYATTLDYLRAMAIRVLEESGLLPHLNPGVLSWADLQRLKPVAPSMGMMLESSSRRLYEEPSGPHAGSPDKDPEVRLRVLTDAGRSLVPFTTGVLIGIGETLPERVQSLLDIRRVAREYSGIQEVIVQNFRAKPGTGMARVPDADLDDLVATVAVARLLLGPGVRLQAPPNLAAGALGALLAAGVDDWGGVSPVTPDHVNPERPWPAITELAAASAAAGFTLVERLTVYPRYVRAGEPWIDPRVAGHVAALAGPDGLAAPGVTPRGAPWQEADLMAAGPGAGTGRVDLHLTIDTEGRRQQIRGDAAAVFGLASGPSTGRVRVAPGAGNPATAVRACARGSVRAAVRAALRRAERSPAALSDSDAVLLLDARPGPELDALAALADALRQEAVGDTVTYVVTRNINFTNVCYTGCRFCAFAQRRTDPDAYTLSLEEIGNRARQAWDAGATEVCLQGGIHPDMPGTAYFDIARTVKTAAPGLHLHAFSPMEIVTGAAKSGLSVREWLVRAREAGLDSIPGTAAEILDDDVRWVLTRGKLPAADWVEVIRTAHAVGLPSTATMMYGHVDAPRHWVAHIKLLARLQAESGGFTEFVLLPFVHTSSPIYLAGLARPGPTRQENRAVHALARILLHGQISHVQCSWVKLGPEGCVTVLSGGVDDLGGTLMEETISRMAGSLYGSRKSVSELEAIAAAAGRPARQRTTLYGEVSAERAAVARAGDGLPWVAEGEPAGTVPVSLPAGTG